MTYDYKQLCAELHAALEKHDLSLAEDQLLDRSAAALRAALAEPEGHIGYPSYEQIQRFMFEVGFNIQDPDVEPAFPRAEYMKLAARIVDWSRTQ